MVDEPGQFDAARGEKAVNGPNGDAPAVGAWVLAGSGAVNDDLPSRAVNTDLMDLTAS